MYLHTLSAPQVHRGQTHTGPVDKMVEEGGEGGREGGKRKGEDDRRDRRRKTSEGDAFKNEVHMSVQCKLLDTGGKISHFPSATFHFSSPTYQCLNHTWPFSPHPAQKGKDANTALCLHLIQHCIE